MTVPGEANGRKYNNTHALLLQPSSWLTCYCLDTFSSSSSSSSSFSKLSRGSWGDGGSAQSTPPAQYCTCGGCSQHVYLPPGNNYCAPSRQWCYFDVQDNAGYCYGVRQGQLSGRWLRCC